MLATRERSKQNINVLQSAFCPVVATGLGGCFSQLSFVLAGEIRVYFFKIRDGKRREGPQLTM